VRKGRPAVVGQRSQHGINARLVVSRRRECARGVPRADQIVA
jgi:hypothetical protein